MVVDEPWGMQDAPMLSVEIQVKGELDKNWAEWFEGLTITHTVYGETVMAGPVKDLAALYGLFARLRDLNLPLISLKLETEPDLQVARKG